MVRRKAKRAHPLPDAHHDASGRGHSLLYRDHPTRLSRVFVSLDASFAMSLPVVTIDIDYSAEKGA